MLRPLLALLTATTAQAQGQAPATSSTTPETALYLEARAGVLRVEAGLGHGSGFLVDSAGFVLTNDHVIGTAGADASVYIDSVTRVRASVVARDPDADLAVLRIPMEACLDCTPLRLAPSPVMISPGERVVALGYPLGQPLTLSTGYVGSVRGSALLTETPINPGNSGGPLLTLDGSVVAVNTFREPDERGIGAGLSGAVLVDQAGPLLNRARRAAAPQPLTKLPVMPTRGYPIRTLKQVADTTDPRFYHQVAALDAGPFTVSISTPVAQMVRSLSLGREVARDRQRREERAGLEKSERYSDLGQIRDWQEFVGEPTAPVVTLLVQPRVGETFGSALGRGLSFALVGWADAATLKFQGDVRKVTLKRDGEIVHPLRGGHGPVRIFVENAWVRLKDVADMGYYVYPFEAFSPRSNGQPPNLTVEIEDLKAPGKVHSMSLSRFASARTWNDFEAFVRFSQPQAEFKAFKFVRQCAVNSGAAAMGAVATEESGSECLYALDLPPK